LYGYENGTCTAQSSDFSKDFESRSFPQEGQYRDPILKRFDEVRTYYRHCRDVINVKIEQIPSFTYTFGGSMLGGHKAIPYLIPLLG
jgi:hypothetical protein